MSERLEWVRGHWETLPLDDERIAELIGLTGENRKNHVQVLRSRLRKQLAERVKQHREETPS